MILDFALKVLRAHGCINEYWLVTAQFILCMMVSFRSHWPAVQDTTICLPDHGMMMFNRFCQLLMLNGQTLGGLCRRL